MLNGKLIIIYLLKYSLILMNQRLASLKIHNIPALYINLERDLEKRNQIEQYLSKLKIGFHRIDAVNGQFLKNSQYRSKVAKILDIPESKLKVSYWMDRKNFKTMTNYQNAVLNKVGCYLSHLLAIQTALDMGLDKVLILEDDIQPLSNINHSFTIPKETDIFYLGGSFFHQKQKMSYTVSKQLAVDTKFLKVNGTFAYIIPSRQKMVDIYNVLMSVFLDGKGKDKSPEFRSGNVRLRAQSIDFAYINHFQTYGSCYVINPVMISHQEMGSNIANNRAKYKLKHILFPQQEKQLKPYFI
jgi:hypothetical protein